MSATTRTPTRRRGAEPALDATKCSTSSPPSPAQSPPNQAKFATATAAVGLANPGTGRVGSRRAPPAQHRGLALAPAMALYGALNGKWASRDTLRSFGRASGFAVTNTQAAGLD